MFNKKKRTYKVKPSKHKRRTQKVSSPYKILASKSPTLPTWYSEGLPKIIHKETIIRQHSPEYLTIPFKEYLYPAWVGKVAYPKQVDLIHGRHMWGIEDGVAKKNIQILWKPHLKIMKKALHTTPKIPHTRQLWTKEQINILRQFYKNANPTYLTLHSYKGKMTSKFELLLENNGPFIIEKLIKEKYVLTTKEYLMGETLIDLKLKPHYFTLKKGTYLFHGTPDFTFDLDNLVAPDLLTDFGGFNRFIFFGLSAMISLWYTVERFSKQAVQKHSSNKTPGTFEAYLNVYHLEKDLKIQYIEDNIIYNQEDTLFRSFCNKAPCLHPQYAFHSIEQLNSARGPVDLDWELTIPINILKKNQLRLIAKYEIDVLKLLKHSSKNINQFDPISSINFRNIM